MGAVAHGGGAILEVHRIGDGSCGRHESGRPEPGRLFIVGVCRCENLDRSRRLLSGWRLQVVLDLVLPGSGGIDQREIGAEQLRVLTVPQGLTICGL